MNAASISQKGLSRTRNEDRHLVMYFANGAFLLAVADGMGGHPGGDVAAEIATDALTAFHSESRVAETEFIELLQLTNWKLSEYTKRHKSLRGFGTTVTAIFIRDHIVTWAHVGHSRLYLLREGALVQVTDDHTLRGLLQRENELTSATVSPYPLKDVLTSCVGARQYEVDTGSFEIEGGDLVLLTTNGLHDAVSEDTMEAILNSSPDLRRKLWALVAAAQNRGSRDDITIIAAEALNN